MLISVYGLYLFSTSNGVRQRLALKPSSVSLFKTVLYTGFVQTVAVTMTQIPPAVERLIEELATVAINNLVSKGQLCPKIPSRPSNLTLHQAHQVPQPEPAVAGACQQLPDQRYQPSPAAKDPHPVKARKW